APHPQRDPARRLSPPPAAVDTRWGRRRRGRTQSVRRVGARGRAARALSPPRERGCGYHGPIVGLIGSRLPDGMQVLRMLERAGPARGYLASDGRRLKAVKLFRRENAARASREYAIGHGLRHPNLKPIEDRVELGGAPGVRMPFTPGVR